MLTPVEATTAGRSASKPAAANPSHQLARRPRSRSAPGRSHVGDAEAELDQAAPLPRLRAGLVDLEDPQAGGEVGPALGEGVEAGAEDDVLGRRRRRPARRRGPRRSGRGPRSRRGTRGCRRGCMSGRSRQPWSGATSCKPDLVVEHVRRRVDLDVQRSPQRGAHGRVVGRLGCTVGHGPLAPVARPAPGGSSCRPSGSRTVISLVP